MRTATDDLLIETERIGGKVKVTARWRGEAVHIDRLDPANASQRHRFVKVLREKLPQASPEAIEGELLRVADQALPTSKDDEGGEKGAEDDPAARSEAEALLRDPNLLSIVLDDIAILGVAGERELASLIYLTGVSRLLEKPLAVIVQGPSSSGKSYVILKVADLFPKDAIILAHQMTPQALFHMPAGSLANRFVVAGERSRVENDDTAEATRALREMLSSGRLSKLMPVKNGGAIETVTIEQEGPIAYIESTTLTNVFEEDANRCVMLHTDERAEQTQRIIRTLAESYSGAGLGAGRKAAIRRRHHCLQGMLVPAPVVIPFAEALGEKFGVRRVEARRAFPQVMTLVQAVALLYQRQRKRDGNGCLVAEPQDYEIARHLLLKPLSRHQGSLSDGARRFAEVLSNEVGVGRAFTSKDAKKREESSPSSVYSWLVALHEAGFLELVEPSRGQRPARWKVIRKDVQDACVDPTLLPTVEEIHVGSWVGRMETSANS